MGRMQLENSGMATTAPEQKGFPENPWQGGRGHQRPSPQLAQNNRALFLATP